MIAPQAALAAARTIREAAPGVARARCLVGFDGFVDSLFRVVSSRPTGGPPVFYRTIPEFAQRIARSAGKSSDTEILLQEVRAGGNGPILAGALARLGPEVCCVGGLGEGKIDEPFLPLADRCRCITLGPAGRTTAFEFDDGKLMFGDDRGLADLRWSELAERVGGDRLRALVRESTLVAVVDWTYLRNMTEIVDGLCENVLARMDTSVRGAKTLFFDLADVSTRTDVDIRAMTACIGRAAHLAPVALGLNENEAEILCRVLDLGDRIAGLAGMATAIAEAVGVGVVVVHGHHAAAGVRDGGTATVEGYYVERPVLTIGGGDVFNAGFCLGLLAGSPIEEALTLGRAAASIHVATGSSPTPGELIERLEREP